MVSVSASTIHYLARPHVFSLLLTTVALWLLDEDRQRPGALVWTLVPLSALWANLHGGFVGLLPILGLLLATSLIGAKPSGLSGSGPSSLRPPGFRLDTDALRAAVTVNSGPARNENGGTRNAVSPKSTTSARRLPARWTSGDDSGAVWCSQNGRKAEK